MSTTIMPTEIEEDLVVAVSMVTRALGALQKVEQSGRLPGGEQGAAQQTLAYARGHIAQALGVGESEYLGLVDLVGMRVFNGWIDAATIDGTYAGMTVYRYDTKDQQSLYSVKELLDPDNGFSFWHNRVENLAAHLVAQFRVRADASYVVGSRPKP
jgi:hypothetical protein